MAAPPILFPPPVWTNQDIALYHGTVDVFAAAIVGGVNVKMGRTGTDFGPGFYTSSVYQQAYMWAAEIAASRSGTLPAVIEITVSREALARLATLVFVRGDFHADDYWSFVHYCRRGATDHHRLGRLHARRYYDVVYGPVAAFWNQRMIIANADQISFHTKAAEKVLNASPRKRII